MCKFVGLNVNKIEKGNHCVTHVLSLINLISGRNETFSCLP